MCSPHKKKKNIVSSFNQLSRELEILSPEHIIGSTSSIPLWCDYCNKCHQQPVPNFNLMGNSWEVSGINSLVWAAWKHSLWFAVFNVKAQHQGTLSFNMLVHTLPWLNPLQDLNISDSLAHHITALNQHTAKQPRKPLCMGDGDIVGRHWGRTVAWKMTFLTQHPDNTRSQSYKSSLCVLIQITRRETAEALNIY